MDIFVNNNNKFTKCKHFTSKSEDQIETFLEKNPHILENELEIIGRQVNIKPHGKIDLLGLDSKNNLVIIEVKKYMPTHNVIGQIIDYYTWACRCDIANFIKIRKKSKLKTPKLTKMIKMMTHSNIVNLNEHPRLYVIAEHIPKNVVASVEKLREKNFDAECVEIQFYDNKRKIIVNKIFDSIISSDGASKYHNADKSVLDLIDKIKKMFKTWKNVEIIDQRSYIAFQCQRHNFFTLHPSKRHLKAHILMRNLNDPKKLTKPYNIKKFNGRVWVLIVNKSNLEYFGYLVKQAYDVNCK